MYKKHFYLLLSLVSNFCVKLKYKTKIKVFILLLSSFSLKVSGSPIFGIGNYFISILNKEIKKFTSSPFRFNLKVQVTKHFVVNCLSKWF
jgi:hypothetical protein